MEKQIHSFIDPIGYRSFRDGPNAEPDILLHFVNPRNALEHVIALSTQIQKEGLTDHIRSSEEVCASIAFPYSEEINRTISMDSASTLVGSTCPISQIQPESRQAIPVRLARHRVWAAAKPSPITRISSSVALSSFIDCAALNRRFTFTSKQNTEGKPLAVGGPQYIENLYKYIANDAMGSQASVVLSSDESILPYWKHLRQLETRTRQACKTKMPGDTPQLLDANPSGRTAIFPWSSRPSSTVSSIYGKCRGYTPALDGPPQTETQQTYSTDEFVCSGLAYFGHTASPAISERCRVFGKPTLKSVPPELAQKVLLERMPCSEEKSVCRTLVTVIEFQRTKLYAAREIGDLKQPIVSRLRITIDNRLLGENVLDGVVKHLGNYALSVVVVNLNDVEALQITQAIEQLYCQVALHSCHKPKSVPSKLTLRIRKRRIAKWQVVNHYGKARKQALPLRYTPKLEAVVPIHQWAQVHWNVLQSLVAQRELKKPNGVFDGFILGMQHQGNEVAVGRLSNVTGLVYENGELPHRSTSFNTKNAGGHPPALGGRPFREDQPLYTTAGCGYSSLPKYKHMFSIVETNICSTYRKAA